LTTGEQCEKIAENCLLSWQLRLSFLSKHKLWGYDMTKPRGWRCFALAMTLVLILGLCAVGVTPSHAGINHVGTSVETSTGTGTATFYVDVGELGDLSAVDASATGCGPPPSDQTFPHGLFSFNIWVGQSQTVTLTIVLPSDVPVGTKYWKCINGQWVDCTSCLGSDNGDNEVTLTLTDNGPCDADPRVGIIADPGGPAVVTAGGAVAGLPAGPGASPKIPRPLNPSNVSLQYLSITPQQTSAGQPVTITTNVVNTGDEAGNYNVTLKINGQVEEAKMVSVGPQGTQPVKFTVIKDQPGTYSVDVLGKTGSFTILGGGGTTGSNTGGLIALALIGVLVIATIVVLLIRRT
jgi:hypothetical protein